MENGWKKHVFLNMGFGHNHYIKLYYGADNLEIKEIVLTPKR